jgi:RsiW-degrading membrane proteinase PrsW (M82 family)
MVKNNSEDKIFANILLPLMALMAPFLVWPIEYFLPYPYLIEEFIKAILVFNIIYFVNKQHQLMIAAIIGILFSLSETVLYSFNFFPLNSIMPFFYRIFATTLLHSGTILIMLLFSIKSKKLFPIGLTVAILIHYLYNKII